MKTASSTWMGWSFLGFVSVIDEVLGESFFAIVMRKLYEDGSAGVKVGERRYGGSSCLEALYKCGMWSRES